MKEYLLALFTYIFYSVYCVVVVDGSSLLLLLLCTVCFTSLSFYFSLSFLIYLFHNFLFHLAFLFSACSTHTAGVISDANTLLQFYFEIPLSARWLLNKCVLYTQAYKYMYNVVFYVCVCAFKSGLLQYFYICLTLFFLYSVRANLYIYICTTAPSLPC